MRTLAGVPGFSHRYTSLAQFPITGSTPLFPDIAAQFPSYPFVDVAQRIHHFGNAEVTCHARHTRLNLAVARQGHPLERVVERLGGLIFYDRLNVTTTN
jgi:hypothetical protein